MDADAMAVREQVWMDRVRACNESGLSRKEWCEANNLKVASLYSWQNRSRKKLSKQLNPLKEQEENEFIRIPDQLVRATIPENGAHSSMPVYVHIGNMSLEIHEGVSEPLIKMVIGQVRAYAG